MILSRKCFKFESTSGSCQSGRYTINNMMVDSNFSRFHKMNYDHICNQYRESFKIRSGGFDIGSVGFFGEYLKSKDQLKEPVFYFAIPIKNQEENIESILAKLLENCNFLFSIGLFFDNCNDKSLEVTVDFLNHQFWQYKYLTKVQIFISENDLFEATCENILLKFCDAKYFVSLQADNYLSDATFLSRAIQFFDRQKVIFGVSSRAVVTLTPQPKFLNYLHKILVGCWRILRSPIDFRTKIRLGPYFPFQDYFGDKATVGISKMKFGEREINSLFIGEAIIRGPIVWDAEKLKTLEGFDDVNFPLGRDDCDVSLRAQSRGWVVGYLPSSCYSIPSMGTTRKPRLSDAQNSLKARSRISKISEMPVEDYWQLRRNKRTNLLNFKGSKTLL
jgi:hypothetical protein